MKQIVFVKQFHHYRFLLMQVAAVTLVLALSATVTATVSQRDPSEQSERATSEVKDASSVTGISQPLSVDLLNPLQRKSRGVVLAPTIIITPDPLYGRSLYADSNSSAARQAVEWQLSRPADAKLMAQIALQPVARWFGGWNQNVESDVREYVQAAQAKGALPVIVAYNIPQRDCGSYSAGGASTDSAYKKWIRDLARGMAAAEVAVILEPDALAAIDCLDADARDTRLKLLSDAVSVLKRQPATSVYVDAGNPRWQSPNVMAERLKAANIFAADGFSLNVSNFITTEENTAYGNALSQIIEGKHFVIDTSRNGAGPTADMQWCNPQDRALGALPTTRTNEPLVDAYMWIKAPGESDGSCNGAPSAGVWWPDYALGLARKAGW